MTKNVAFVRHFLLIALMNPHGLRFWNTQKQVCNICERRPWFWLPRGHQNPVIEEKGIIGAGKRYVDCLFCGSSDRDRLVFEAFKQNESLFLKGNLLHIAPEKPLWRRWFSQGWNRIGVDARAEGYRWSYSADVLVGDLRYLDFSDGYFHAIVANHVLEHIEQVELALQQIYRMLKTGGIACLQVPFSSILEESIEAEPGWDKKQREAIFGQWDHVRLYGKHFLKEWEELGFESVNINFTPEARLQHRMHPTEPVIILRKK